MHSYTCKICDVNSSFSLAFLNTILTFFSLSFLFLFYTYTEGQLIPKSVDLQRTVNRYAHKTSQYEMPNLILRRGQPFEIHVVLDRNFVPSEDTIVLKFVTGSRPLQSKGTVVSVQRVQELKPHQWGYEITSIEEKKVAMRVSSASDSIVGRYQLFVDTTHRNPQGEIDKYRYKNPDDVYILFNPWCRADAVFLEDEDERQHHVLSETGRIWLGTVGKFCVRPWNFAQFDDVCLMAALALMDKSELGDQARGSPTLVVRALCRAVSKNNLLALFLLMQTPHCKLKSFYAKSVDI
ncbi:TGM1 [Acanthosepion pharaonis]|uniref:TGM1 n=1 Tax=Acanthosepion pharaonis TaxID=158019 RepID=A0A812CHS9_ACAPH|nr:TGM1 [Sepia pharaonis]